MTWTVCLGFLRRRKVLPKAPKTVPGQWRTEQRQKQAGTRLPPSKGVLKVLSFNIAAAEQCDSCPPPSILIYRWLFVQRVTNDKSVRIVSLIIFCRSHEITNTEYGAKKSYFWVMFSLALFCFCAKALPARQDCRFKGNFSPSRTRICKDGITVTCR